MDIHKLKRILNRYLNGKSNETETALIEAWYRSYDADEQQINDAEEGAIRKAISENIKSTIVKPSVFKLPVIRLAAGLTIFSALSFLIGNYYYANKTRGGNFQTIVTGVKGLKEVNLADGSVIWLNAASRLKVPDSFKGHLREVFLDEGEAFFNIKRDLQHPFIVHTSSLNVQVLGTSFNIKAYRKLPAVEVSVTTGKVGVTRNQRTLAMLLPGRQLNYYPTNGKIIQKQVDRYKAQSWKQGYTYLTQATFDELSVVVKNIYGLSLKPGSKKISAFKFTFRLTHNLPPDSILKLISGMHNTQCRKEGNDIVLY